MLPKSPYTSSNTTPPPLTLHNGQIFTASNKGKFATYDPHVGKWTELENLNMNLGNQHDFVLISYNSNLYTITASKTNTECVIYSIDPDFKLKKIHKFGYLSLRCAAIASGFMFFFTGEEIYKVSLEEKQEKIKTPTKIASPPNEGFTLYAIKNTLFSFGGRDRDNQPTSDVLRYNLDTDTWESASYMRSARYNVAVTTMQDTTLDVFVLGGSFGSSQYTAEQQECIKGFGFSIVPAVQSSSYKLTWNNTTSIFEKCTVN